MSDKTQSLHIKLPIEGYEILKEAAKQQRRPIADVVRLAIEKHLSELGYNVDLTVDRGGARSPDSG